MKLEFPLRPQRTNPVYSRKGRARLTCADKAGVPPVRSEVPASLAQTNQNFTRKLPLHLRRQTRSSSISSRSPCAGKAEVPPQGAAGGPPRRGQRGPEARRAPAPAKSSDHVRVAGHVRVADLVRVADHIRLSQQHESMAWL